jgi:hypothetical protein
MLSAVGRGALATSAAPGGRCAARLAALNDPASAACVTRARNAGGARRIVPHPSPDWRRSPTAHEPRCAAAAPAAVPKTRPSPVRPRRGALGSNRAGCAATPAPNSGLLYVGSSSSPAPRPIEAARIKAPRVSKRDARRPQYQRSGGRLASKQRTRPAVRLRAERAGTIRSRDATPGTSSISPMLDFPGQPDTRKRA